MLYQIGDIVRKKGCFTEEYCIKGLNVWQIGIELGLPAHLLNDGIFIGFARTLPRFEDFELGGWTKYPTDQFFDYKNNNWSLSKFEETYDGIRMPVSIEAAKNAWLKNMRYEKLVKVLPVIFDKDAKYPEGKLASQIIVRNEIECQIVKFLKGNDIFRGVWS